MMKRIIIHWTAGSHTPSNLDKEHYHCIVSGAGALVPGKWPISANINPQPGRYAAHTLNCNTGSIGIAVAAMAGAQERPFSAGRFPITEKQLDALVAACADLAAEYGIPVTRETILTHAEVQPTLGIRQRGKWDITWLPGMPAPLDPVYVGDIIRDRIKDAMTPNPPVFITPKPVEHKPLTSTGFDASEAPISSRQPSLSWWGLFLEWMKGQKK